MCTELQEGAILKMCNLPVPYHKSYWYLILNNLELNSSYFLPNLCSVPHSPAPGSWFCWLSWVLGSSPHPLCSRGHSSGFQCPLPPFCPPLCHQSGPSKMLCIERINFQTLNMHPKLSMAWLLVKNFLAFPERVSFSYNVIYGFCIVPPLFQFSCSCTFCFEFRITCSLERCHSSFKFHLIYQSV